MAGFTPSRHRFVYNKLKDIVKIVADKYIKDGHIPVASVEAFIAPDPLGVLNPGEIYFSSTKPLRDEVTLENYNHIKGEVLIYRNPCRLPSDVQKVNAVYRSELESWQDIILYSTKGDQSLPSWLAGGGGCKTWTPLTATDLFPRRCRWRHRCHHPTPKNYRHFREF
ncbi:hypothetical protein PUNSTDRAFT_49107 [Punctularia strigosozonata HHB-11173 SS5]|uniref:uncharacterized protein n=1 Tax=Punctularia strigosozonata (strain HHB-11173) TaxID=741275 RepID=UPI0004416B1B|nr:uncharacterized protein PUNSTDRAFT_49107 [Punctularia strigosozonata HHB-11173 SS5]EIN14283.1 hypothetical protein PUNSTDRAFT_49107 [Punctularia strigosozonata HHB-11173 SS5]